MNDYYVEVTSNDKLVGINVDNLSEIEKHRLTLIASKSFQAGSDDSAKEHAREYSEGITLPRSITGNDRVSMPAQTLLYRVDKKLDKIAYTSIPVF